MPARSGAAAPGFTAPLDGIRATARRLQESSRAARALCDHPGRVRGLAQDGGDVELRDAGAELARRWQWALDGLAEGTGRWAALLDVVADHYVETEREVAGGVGYAEWLAGRRAAR